MSLCVWRCCAALVPLLGSISIAAPSEAQWSYPATRTVDQVDDYHGTRVPDPYRWLEDDTSAATAAWVKAQNELTFGYLAKLPARAELRRRLEDVYDYPKYSTPFRRGPYLLFQKNAGLQDQFVLYAQVGERGAPRVLIDPNTLSSDGTTRLGTARPSKNAEYLGYGLSRGGSDWQEYFVKRMATNQDLPDRLRWVKVSGLAWRGNGFYYSRYPAPLDTNNVLSAKNENHQVWYHRVGTPQSADSLVYADSAHPQRFHTVSTTEDERFAILSIEDRGAGKDGNAIYALDARKPGGRFVPVVTEFDNHFDVVDNEDAKLLVMTDRKAPNWRLVLIDPAHPAEANWKDIIPERPERLDAVQAAGGKLFAVYLKDAANRVYVFDRTGKRENEIQLPDIGLAYGFNGRAEDKDVFWTFTGFTVPSTIYRYRISSRTSTIFRKPDVKFDPAKYETKQVFFPSKDGTKIPMFIVHRRGLALDGKNPTLIYGYGGFNISLGPAFDPLLIPLLERGVVYALVNLRGGSEYGEAWHEAGWRDKKQNVFDDFIAAAEWLQANGYTSKERCALQGGSNGGLLVGAVMTQRPDLCKVALPEVGVMDMLRFQRFTIGWNWAAEYGSSDDPKMFPVLFRYSPLHNIEEGVTYPATLVTTADHDDRVVPAHSFKFIATLQAKGKGPNPYLIRIETRSGHGAVSTTKRLDETADVDAFMLTQLAAASP
jgi:prolyl oligopeptidase